VDLGFDRIATMSETTRVIQIVNLLNQDEEALAVLKNRGEKPARYYSLLIDKIIRRAGKIPFRPPPTNTQRSMFGVV